jgi:hypothetical protein
MLAIVLSMVLVRVAASLAWIERVSLLERSVFFCPFGKLGTYLLRLCLVLNVFNYFVIMAGAIA